jgi:Flp pilus assembly protein TadG
MSNLTGLQMRPRERGAISIKVALILVFLFVAGFTVLKVTPAYVEQTKVLHDVNELARIAAVRGWKEERINQDIKRIRTEYELPDNAISLVGRDNGVQITIGYQRNIDLFVTNYTWRVDQTAIGKDL